MELTIKVEYDNENEFKSFKDQLMDVIAPYIAESNQIRDDQKGFIDEFVLLLSNDQVRYEELEDIAVKAGYDENEAASLIQCMMNRYWFKIEFALIRDFECGKLDF